MTDFLDEKRREINDRLAELKPLIDEYTRLEAAATALAGVGGSAPASRARPLPRRAGGACATWTWPSARLEEHDNGHQTPWSSARVQEQEDHGRRCPRCSDSHTSHASSSRRPP